MIRILTTGGTFDKVYFDAKSEFHVGDSEIPDMLHEANVTSEITVESVLRKDSLELTNADRSLLRDRVAAASEARILIVHGTDTMVQSANWLLDITGKTIVFTGAMQPSRMRRSDAMFNLGFALAALQVLAPGIYVAMNGRIFDPKNVQKNLKAGRFEASEPG